jgi:transposase-like protein
MIERQELYCHACGNYVQFDLDVEMEGNHVLTCPKCGHEHCRVVKDGKVTEDRWDQRNIDQTYTVSSSTMTYTTVSTTTTYTSATTTNVGTWYMYGAWTNHTTSS